MLEVQSGPVTGKIALNSAWPGSENCNEKEKMLPKWHRFCHKCDIRFGYHYKLMIPCTNKTCTIIFSRSIFMFSYNLIFSEVEEFRLVSGEAHDDPEAGQRHLGGEQGRRVGTGEEREGARGPVARGGAGASGERRSRQHGGVAKITGDILIRL